MDPASFQHSINVFFEITKLGFGQVVDGAIKEVRSRSKRSLVIYAGAMWRKFGDFFVFEDIGELSIFEGDRSRSGGRGYRFGRDVVRSKVRIEVNRSSEGFFVASNICDREKEELVTLWIDLSDRKDSREKALWMEIGRIRRIARFNG